MATYKRRQNGPQLPKIVVHGLEAVREAGGLDNWAAVAREVEARELRHPEFKAGRAEDTWRALVRNDGSRELSYGHLELLEGVTGVPSGTILSVTGACALLRKTTNKDHVLAYAAGLKKLAAGLEAQAKTGRALTTGEAQTAFMERLFSSWLEHGYNASMPVRKATPEG